MRRMVLCWGMALLLCGGAFAEGPAGTVVYFQSGGEVYLLLAEHHNSRRGWAGFGGGAREGETVAETAATKTHEESRGYYKKEDILEKIKGLKPVVAGDFATYFVEVPFVPVQQIMNHRIPDEENDAYSERSTFAWVPYSTMADFLNEDLSKNRLIKYMVAPTFLPAGSETQWLWPAWLRSMRAAVATNTLPWKSKSPMK
ncbi:MAG: ADP-ribose pyrophosphatase YjhB (NUDIX family) [Candidatus Latescibacterota bacterium]|jgi:ADP-ribose pyrophosphatase YjhB (NUDIX family)